MNRVIAFLVAIVLAGYLASPLMERLVGIVLKGEGRSVTMTPDDLWNDYMLFTLSVCGCAGLVVAAGFGFPKFPVAMRWMIATIPLLCIATAATIALATQFADSVSKARAISQLMGPPYQSFSLGKPSFYWVPLVSFLGELLVVFVASVFHEKMICESRRSWATKR